MLPVGADAAAWGDDAARLRDSAGMRILRRAVCAVDDGQHDSAADLVPAPRSAVRLVAPETGARDLTECGYRF